MQQYLAHTKWNEKWARRLWQCYFPKGVHRELSSQPCLSLILSVRHLYQLCTVTGASHNVRAAVLTTRLRSDEQSHNPLQLSNVHFVEYWRRQIKELCSTLCNHKLVRCKNSEEMSESLLLCSLYSWWRWWYGVLHVSLLWYRSACSAGLLGLVHTEDG